MYQSYKGQKRHFIIDNIINLNKIETLNSKYQVLFEPAENYHVISLQMQIERTPPNQLFESQWAGVTSRNTDGTYYMSDLSKSFFCFFLKALVNAKYPGTRGNFLIQGSIDLKTLALQYRDQSLQILEASQLLEENNFQFDWAIDERKDYKKVLKWAIQGFNRRYRNLQLDWETTEEAFLNIAYYDEELPSLLRYESDDLKEFLLHPPNQIVTLSFKQPKNCARCRYPLNLIDVETERQICSNEDCIQNIPRRRNDIVFLPNFTEKMTFHNPQPLNQLISRRWANKGLMPLINGENNIEFEVENRFSFQNRLIWRGGLRGKILRSTLSYLPYTYANPILHAMKHENKIAVEIRPVDWLEGPENMGVIATSTIPRNTVIAVYSGDVILASQDNYWVHNSAMVNLGWIGNEQVFIRPDQTANVGRYLNGCLDKDEANVKTEWILIERQPPMVPRMVGQLELVLTMISRKTIRPNQELLWHYGSAYNNAYLL